jgi:hypothetical protein
MAARRDRPVPRAEIEADLDVAEHMRAQLLRIGECYLDPGYVPSAGETTADGFRAEVAKFDREIAGLRAALSGP